MRNNTASSFREQVCITNRTRALSNNTRFGKIRYLAVGRQGKGVWLTDTNKISTRYKREVKMGLASKLKVAKGPKSGLTRNETSLQ